MEAQMEECEIAARQKKLDYYIADGSDSIYIKHLQSTEDLCADSDWFHPPFVQKLLGDKEVIYGYENLRVNIYLTKARLYPYFTFTYGDKSEDADDLGKYFEKYFDGKCTAEFAKLNEAMEKEEINYVPMGNVVRTFQSEPGEAFWLYKVKAAEIEELGDSLQSVLMLFTCMCSRIKVDPYWNYYLLYRVTEEKDFTIVGYAATCESHQSVDKYRTCISQFLVLPGFQRKGFGREILRGIYEDLRSDAKCFEITIGPPSDEFLAMRDLFNVSLVLPQFACFKDLGPEFKIGRANYRNYAVNKNDIRGACKELKITRVEVERCIEMIKFAHLDPEDTDAAKQYRLDVKKRLFIMQKSSLHPNERIARIKNKQIPQPVIVLELSSDKDSEERFDVELKERKRVLSKLYDEVCIWYQHLAPKIPSLV